MSKYNYQNYGEISPSVEAYILTVAAAEMIYDVPLGDINDFMNGYEEWENDPALQYSATTSGW
jgi:hypothetical protein